MLDIIREAAIGQAIRFISRNRLLQYPEERPDFVLPPQYASLLNGDEKPKEEYDSTPQNEAYDSDHDVEALGRARTVTSVRSAPFSQDRVEAERTLSMQRTKTIPIVPQKTTDGIVLVDWYTTDDAANPQNWSGSKKGFVVFILAIYTFTVYCAGPIWATSAEGIVHHFGVSPVAATLGLSLYVLAYGVGDVFFSPITEIPVVGRNPVYYLTFIVFWVLAFPAAVQNSFGGLLALRFWMGFFGSPALANGGATVGDMFDLIYIPYGLSWWVLSAWCGPAFGPGKYSIPRALSAS
jgi:MFS transporter, DHA1 family, multidrug resistance protein